MLESAINTKFTHWIFFHLFICSTKSYGNKVILLIFLMFLLFKKKCIGINCSTKWIWIVYKLLRLWADMAPFCIMIYILSMIFILLIILLVLCNTTTKCSDHGTCGDDGNCICDNGYYGPNCSSKYRFFECWLHTAANSSKGSHLNFYDLKLSFR